jgi:hypothetical protein
MSVSAEVLAQLASEVGRPSGLARADLRDAWRRMVKCEPPNVSRDLLLRALAYEVQTQRLGGLSKDAARVLAGVLSG